ncbi:unnamed protein product [Lymnaea stagnalis]|uniref:Nudix hydrolase domain-containing protein n=1 Tax=Lymnaea stagnalis TaxID=6523 RepID=A0AAV2HG82_LYMST
MKDSDLLTVIIERLSSFDIRKCGPYPETTNDFKRAAVLLPLTVKNGEIFILLTKRSKNLRTHPSAVSFPGGVRDNSDKTDVETALREAKEEIGLPPECVKILAILTRGVTLPNTVVYPVVGLIQNNFKPVPNPSEVEFAFYMPLKDFLNEEKISYSTFNVRGRKFLSRSVKYSDGEKSANVWGFTANYCIFLAKIVHGLPDFLPVFDDSKDSKDNTLQAGLVEYFNFVTSMTKSKL